MFFYLCRFICWLPLAILFPTKIVGRENLKKGGAILTANHTSNLDIVLLLANTHEKKFTLAKKELFKNKFISWVLKSYGGISINREGNDISAIKNSLKVLNLNKKLIIFPEGTRNKNVDIQKMGDAKAGTSLLAIKSKKPIIPVWISRRPKLFRITKIYIGKPFELNEFYDQKLNEEILNKSTAKIVEKIEELR